MNAGTGHQRLTATFFEIECPEMLIRGIFVSYPH